jgi:hypothetical protein
MLVELSPEQMLTCHEEAVGRAEHYVQGRRKNMKDGLTAEQVISYNVDGCMGELAVAVATGLEWTGVFGPDRHDVGDRIWKQTDAHQPPPTFWRSSKAPRCVSQAGVIWITSSSTAQPTSRRAWSSWLSPKPTSCRSVTCDERP